MKSQHILAVISAFALTGCTTLSFAPPEVEVNRRASGRSSSECGKPISGQGQAIRKDVDGALYLVDNFIAAYRCASREAADGRQLFEVPSFLSIVTAAVGPSFGLGQNWQLGTATAGGVFAQANSYYAPKEKAKILDSALDALLCVKTEAAGAGYFDTRTTASSVEDQNDEAAIARIEATLVGLQAASSEIENLISADSESINQARKDRDAGAEQLLIAQKRARVEQALRYQQLSGNLIAQRAELVSRITLRRQSAGLMMMDNGGTIAIDPSRKYFEMVSAASLSIERILADQLSNVGNFDSAGIAAQFKEIVEAQAKAAKKVEEAEGGQVNGALATFVMKGPGITAYRTNEAKAADIVNLQLDLLQTKLQACVVRAKIS